MSLAYLTDIIILLAAAVVAVPLARMTGLEIPARQPYIIQTGMTHPTP